MATVLQFRGFDTTSLSGIVGSERELYIDTSLSTVVVMDGSTAGGTPLATQNYVGSYCATPAFLSSVLTSYASLAYITSTLTSYPTNANLTSTLESYTTNDDLTSTLASYITNANLTSTLANYTTNANLTSTLANYTTNANLTSTLVNYLTTTSLSTSFTLNANLTSTLASYTTNANLTSTLSSYATKTFVTSALTSYATLNYVDTAISNAATASGTIADLNLAGGVTFYTGASSTSLTAGITYSSATLNAGATSITILNVAPWGAVTSVLSAASGSTVFVTTSSSSTQLSLSLDLTSAPVSSTATTLLYNSGSFSPTTIYMNQTASLTIAGTTSTLHYVVVDRAAVPAQVTLNENNGDISVTGSIITFNMAVTQATSYNVYEINTYPTITLAVTSNSETIWSGGNVALRDIGVGFTTSTGTFDGSTTGYLLFTNPNGVKYYSNGRIEFPNITFNSSGTIIVPVGASIIDTNGSSIVSLSVGSSVGTITPVSLGSDILFYTGTSISNLATNTNYSSAQISAYSSSLFIINPVPATVTSVVNTVLENTLIFASTSSASTSYEISFRVTSPGASYTSGDVVTTGLYSDYFAPTTLSSGATFTASTSANPTKAHAIFIVRAAVPQYYNLVEGTDFTVTGTLITLTFTATQATQIQVYEDDTGPAGLRIPVEAQSSVTDVVWANENTAFSNLSVGYTTSSATFNGGSPGRLVYTNPNGVRYYSDGSIVYPNGLSYDSSGTIILPAGAQVKNAVGDVLIDATSSYVAAATLTSTLISYPTFTDVTSILTTYATDTEVSSSIAATSSALSGVITDKVDNAVLYSTYTSSFTGLMVGNTVTLDALYSTNRVNMNTSINSITWLNLPPAGKSTDVDVLFTQTTTGNTFTLPSATGDVISIKSSVSSLSTTSGLSDGLRFRLFNDSLSPFTTSVSIYIYPLWSGV